MAKVKKVYYPNQTKKPHRTNTFCVSLKKFIGAMFYFIRYYIDVFIDYMFGLYYNSKVQRIEPATNPIILESATSLARKIRKRELTCEEVVGAFVERAKQVNGLVNAIVGERFDDALEEARQLDKDIATGQIQDCDFQEKPFLGIPITTKESTAVKGLSHTFGLLSRQTKTATYDADVIERMKRAGAIVIGVTNVPQLNMWQETSNPIYGVTNNPYNVTRNVGGSSGGESSILAAGGSALGIGSDIGGSIRIPAFMCGVFGHKPTSHLISTCGLTFRTGKEATTMVVAGPMTRYADDLIPCLKVLIDADKIEKLSLNQAVNIPSLNVFYVTCPNDPFVSAQRPVMQQTMAKVVEHFMEVLNNKPVEVEISELRYGGKLWRYWLTQESGANFKKDLTNRENEIGALTEILRYCCLNSPYSAAVIFNLVNSLLPKEKEDWAKETTEILKRKLLDLLGTNGVLLYPCAPWPASYHHTALLRPWNFNLFSIWNALKFPVTQVPLGLSEDGLPVGIQVVAPPFQDHLCLAVAKELEKAFGGYVPPFILTS